MPEPPDRDRLVRLKDIPRCDAGSPCPAVVADEQLAHLSFYSAAEEDMAVIVTFWAAADLRFGSPGESALEDHALNARGLRPGKAYEVLRSSWLGNRRAQAAERSIEAVEDLKRLRHYVFSFHDSLFECLSEGYTVKEVPGPTPLKLAVELAMELRGV